MSELFQTPTQQNFCAADDSCSLYDVLQVLKAIERLPALSQSIIEASTENSIDKIQKQLLVLHENLAEISVCAGQAKEHVLNLTTLETADGVLPPFISIGKKQCNEASALC